MSDIKSLADFLVSHRPAVLDAFITEVRKASGAPGELPRPALIDHLPAFLAELGTQLEQRSSSPPGAPPEAATEHGSQRLALGYSLAAVVDEYEVLRQVLLDQARKAGVQLTVEDLDLVGRLFIRAIGQAVNAYVADNDKQKAAQEAELDYLVHAGKSLMSSLDTKVTLTRLTGLLVPRLADWCVVHIAGDEPLEPAVAHANPERLAEARSLAALAPAREHLGPAAVLESGEPLLVEDASGGGGEFDAAYRAHLQTLGTCGWMVVPIQGRGTALGAITLGTSESARRYGKKDVSTVLELARRAGAALENALLFESSQRERARVEALTRAKDEFVMVVSHELRTPMNTILGWSRLLRTDALPPSRRQHALEVIERSVSAQTQLVSDLLDISNVTTGRIRLNPSQVDLSTLIDLVLEEMRLALEAKRITLTVDLDRPRAVMRGDADRLQQIVWNLLSNAIKFTPKNGRVHVALRRVASDLEIVVRDSGEGIAPEFLAHVFDPFLQSDMSASRPHPGLGIGLAITKHLVALHGGSIAAESPGVGRGATLTVRLPVAPLVSSTFGVGRVPIADETPVWPRGLEGLRALVVDDEAGARDLLLAMLEASGIEVTTASAAQEALASLESHRHDIVVSDIGLAGEDGYALISRIRGLPSKLASTPVVALTASASPDDRQRALVAGFNVHLTKPVAPAELLTAIAELTGRHVRKDR